MTDTKLELSGMEYNLTGFDDREQILVRVSACEVKVVRLKLNHGAGRPNTEELLLNISGEGIEVIEDLT
jgi:hypothetical protein